MNPVIVLDEVDKLGADYRGDPSSALLEVLDPAQNHTFRDHYLEVELDLSKVLFIATANVVETIPGPLLDRMEVIRLDGYTEDEKVAIARHHLVRRQLERAALRPDEVEVHRRRPAGHRRRLHPGGRRPRARARARPAAAQGGARKLGRRRASTAPVVVGRRRRRGAGWAGPASSSRRPTAPPCPAWPPAWPSPGPAATCCSSRPPSMDGRRGSDPHRPAGRRHEGVGRDRPVLRALARRASSASTAEAFTGRRFHVHVPAGAVPKDGPSAGVTMTTALVSLLRAARCGRWSGMTGEVTLQGRVLPIGGVKQKVLAAHRAGLTEVVLPARNGPDLEDVPEEVRDADDVPPGRGRSTTCWPPALGRRRRLRPLPRRCRRRTVGPPRSGRRPADAGSPPSWVDRWVRAGHRRPPPRREHRWTTSRSSRASRAGRRGAPARGGPRGRGPLRGGAAPVGGPRGDAGPAVGPTAPAARPA